MATPRFDFDASPDLSSANVTNVGRATAHQVKVTLAVTGNRTSFLGFSSENVTWSKPEYVSIRNQTIISGSLPRLGVHGVVSIRLDAQSERMEVWASSNETGGYLKKPSAPNPLVDAILETLSSGQFYVVFVVWIIGLTYLASKRPRLRKVWPFY